MKRSSKIVAALAITAGALASWPPLHLVLINADLPSYYQENISYRFFWALRLVDGEPNDFVHPGQGVLLSLIQAVYYLIGKALSLDLYGQIHLFGLLTLAVPAVATVILAIAIAADEKIEVWTRAALVTSPLVMAYGGPVVFAYTLYPDYFAYAKFLFLLMTWRWIHHRSWEGYSSLHATAELGVWGGLIIALKLNYGVLPAGLLLCSFIATVLTRPFDALYGAIVSALAATAAAGICFVIHYAGHLSWVQLFFTVVFSWSSSLPWSPFPIFPLGNPIRGEGTIGWLVVILAAVCIAGLLLALISRRFTALILVIVSGALGVLAVVMVFMRGGGSSYMDAILMLALLAVIAAQSVAYAGARAAASGALAAIFFGWPVWSIAANWHDYSTLSISGHKPLLALGEPGDWQRKLYNWNRSHGLPIFVLMPSNYYTQGTIEDMMNWGFASWPNHTEDSNRNPTRLRRFPDYTFLYFKDTAPNASYKATLPAGRIVLMTTAGKPAPDFGQLPPEVLTRHQAETEELLAGRKREQCYTVKQIMTQVEIVSCVMSVPNG